MRFTERISISRFTSSGTSIRSFTFRSGMITRLMPARRRATTNERERRGDGLLHHVAELSPQRQLALAGHARRLDEQDVAADRGPRQARRDARLRRALRDLADELLRAEELLDLRRV